MVGLDGAPNGATVSGNPADRPRLARVANMETTRLPYTPPITIPSGVAVAIGTDVPDGVALIVTCLAPATLQATMPRGVSTCQLRVGLNRVELPSRASALALTSTAIAIAWLESFAEP